MASFTIEFATLCDFVSYDVQGRFILAGAGGEEIYILGTPDVWPIGHLFLIIKPNQPQFEFEIRLIAPTGKPAVRAVGAYSSEQQPSPFEVVHLNLQLQRVPFPGFGIYSIEVLGGSDAIYQKKLNILQGTAAKRMAPKITLSVASN